MNAERISVIIPTLDAEEYISRLMALLHSQIRSADEIVIVDSESDDGTISALDEYPDIKITSIKRSDFDHGRTRDTALRHSSGDIIIFLTQDALPADSHLIENIAAPFYADDSIAIAMRRHIPRADAWQFERLVRNFNYPPESSIRSSEDIPKTGVKTFFTSDCCCAYRRDIYEKLGGFDFPISTGEDFLFAARAINAGYKIAYVADAVVIHSHNLTLSQQYWRNFRLGYESERHKEYFCGVSQEKEGMKLVKYVSFELLKHGHILSFIQFSFDCVARLLGNKMGKRAYRKNKNVDKKKN